MGIDKNMIISFFPRASIMMLLTGTDCHFPIHSHSDCLRLLFSVCADISVGHQREPHFQLDLFNAIPSVFLLPQPFCPKIWEKKSKIVSHLLKATGNNIIDTETHRSLSATHGMIYVTNNQRER